MATKVYINARFLTQAVTGVQRVATELVKALDCQLSFDKRLRQQFEFTLLAPTKVIQELSLEHIPIHLVGQLSGHLWEQTELPYYSRGSLLVNLGNTAPLIKSDQMVMLHDASPFAAPQTYSLAFRSWYKFLYPKLGRNCLKIMTNTEFSKTELARYAGIDPGKTSVISLGTEHINHAEADHTILDDLADQSEPFLLAVSSRSPNKNFAALVRAASLPQMAKIKIVVAGGSNKRIFQHEDFEVSENMRFIGYVSDPQLRALYESAAGFVYPSTYEGFGLPPMEAMNCGCPVVVSDIPAHREVCGDAALYCDPSRADDIADKILWLMNDKHLQQTLIDKGRARAAQFSWAAVARRFVRLLEDSIPVLVTKISEPLSEPGEPTKVEGVIDVESA